MTYRSLLVSLGPDPLCAERTRVAIALANDFECHVVGVAPTGLVDLQGSPGAAATLADVAARAWDALRGRAERAAQRFRDDCVAAGVESFEALVEESEPASSLVHHAHCNDLSVLTQADPAAAGHRMAHEIVVRVVLRSARPTLILPHVGRCARVGSNVLVAWDDSREAARALADALPLLRRAARVQVVAWNEARVHDGKPLRARLEALQRWLTRHGVAAELRVQTTRVAIAEAIRAHAVELNADLLVMGAYGHSRWAERVLGGATRGLLASMTVPVLMSH